MNSNDILRYIDSLPNLSRAWRSLNRLKDQGVEIKNPELKIASQILNEVSIDKYKACKAISRFSIAESEITVIQGEGNFIKFSVNNISTVDKIASGDVIQLLVTSYQKERESQTYDLYQDKTYYSTCYITYIVSFYNKDINEGVAYITSESGSNNITLIGSQDNILRKVPIAQIFNQYYPIIEDSYIL